MAEARRASFPQDTPEKPLRPPEWSGRTAVGSEDADDLLVKLKDLHARTEQHDALLGVYDLLHESERRFRGMIDALPAAIYTTDAEGRLTHFNSAAAKLSGRTPELGTDQWCVTWKLFWPDGTSMRHDECPMAVALKEGRIVDGQEAIAERPDGTRFWFIPYPRLLRDEKGKVTGGINMLMDITDRKQAESASNLLAAIVGSSDDAIISMNLDGIITSWNRSAERLFGYTAEEAIGQHITLIVPSDRLHEETTILGRLRQGQRIDHFETVRRRKDGALLDISLTISPVKTGAGRVVGASKVARDITERKRAEAALREAEERLGAELTATQRLTEISTQLIVEGSGDALYQKIVDAAIAIMHSDMGSMQMLYPERNQLRLLAWRGFDPESAAFWAWVSLDSGSSCGDVLRTGRRAVMTDIETCDSIADTPDLVASRRCGIRAVQSTPLVSRQGRMLGVISTHWRKTHQPSERDLRLFDLLARQAADLIERSRTLEALSESEERFRAMTNSIPQLAWMANADGDIVWYNQRWYEYTGTTLEQMEGWGWQAVQDPAELPHVLNRWRASLRTGEPFDMEFPLRGSDGGFRWFLTRITPIRDSNGQVTRWFGTNTDVDELRQIREALCKREEQLRALAGKLDAEVRLRTEELERRNGEMLEQAGQLRTLSNRLMQLQDDERRRIARELHDSVGQDLAALSMCLEGAKRVVKGAPQAAVPKLEEASEIVEKCSSEIRTISHLLHPPLLEELGLAAAIEWYVEGFASRSKVEVKLEMPPVFKRMEPSIELPLFRVLQECLTNIHRHSESKTATVKVDADEHKVSLEVSDQGKGIAKRDSKLNGGNPLGVGISGMRERLNDLGGTLEIESTNQGTTVRAAIPLRSDTRAATQ